MSSLLRQTVLGVVVVGSALAGAVSANAQDSCDWYAKTALKQQQENEQKRCGFTGPNWTSDMKAHLAWCQVNPSQFRAEAQRRDQQLATCKK